MASAIYASVDAVNKHRTIFTNIPKDVSLTSNQYNELLELEKAYDSQYKNEFTLARSFNISGTDNPGIHFFCLEKGFALKQLAHNSSLDILVIHLLTHKLTMLDDVSLKNPGIARKFLSERFALMVNPTVLNNFDIFKTVFNTVKDGDRGVIVEALMEGLKTASIDVFMYVIVWVADGNKKSVSKYVKILNSREKEIEEWAVANNHEVAGLPASWILGIYGILTG